MEFTDIKEFMDFHVESYKNTRGTNEFNNQIKLCLPYSLGGIHIYFGIDVIADMLGLDICEIVTDDFDYPFRYEIEYEGVTFFQIEGKRLKAYGLSD